MSNPPPFDLAQVHRSLAADCFNRTWNLIDKADRSSADNEQMLLLSLASLWHWTQRADCTDRNLSIAYWQVSRVYALLGQAENAIHFGQRCLDMSHAQPPFYLAYAHEALARAAKVAGDAARTAHHLQQAQDLAGKVTDPEECAALVKDLATIR